MDRLETVMELRRGSRLGRVSCLAARAATCVIIPRRWGVGTRRIGAKVRSHHRSRSPARANIRVSITKKEVHVILWTTKRYRFKIMAYS